MRGSEVLVREGNRYTNPEFNSQYDGAKNAGLYGAFATDVA